MDAVEFLDEKIQDGLVKLHSIGTRYCDDSGIRPALLPGLSSAPLFESSKPVRI